MPELPDIEIRKRYLDSTSLHQKIEAVEVNAPIVLDGLTPAALGKALVGQSFESTRRHGKHLFVELSEGDWMNMHFGMTGDLQYYKKPERQPDYSQVLFHFQNDYQLAYVMPRKLGHIRLIDSIGAFIEEKELGPDALEVGFDRFHELFSGRRGMIKPALMDQSILAGIGNVYSDEILYQARIYPRKQIKELEDGGLRKVYNSMKEVFETALEHNSEPAQYPDSFLIHHRSEGEPCPRCGGEVQKIDVSGRSGYYCPDCQDGRL